MKGTTIVYWPRDPYGELAEPAQPKESIISGDATPDADARIREL